MKPTDGNHALEARALPGGAPTTAALVAGALLGAVALGAGPAFASQDVRAVEVIGHLRAGGGPVPDGDYGLTVALYAGKDDNKALAIFVDPGVKVASGAFRMTLGGPGKGGPLDTKLFESGAARWLGVRVGSEKELPRVALTATPYALSALTAHGLSCTGCIKSEQLDKAFLGAIGDQLATLKAGIEIKLALAKDQVSKLNKAVDALNKAKASLEAAVAKNQLGLAGIDKKLAEVSAGVTKAQEAIHALDTELKKAVQVGITNAARITKIDQRVGGLDAGLKQVDGATKTLGSTLATLQEQHAKDIGAAATGRAANAVAIAAQAKIRSEVAVYEDNASDWSGWVSGGSWKTFNGVSKTITLTRRSLLIAMANGHMMRSSGGNPWMYCAFFYDNYKPNGGDWNQLHQYANEVSTWSTFALHSMAILGKGKHTVELRCRSIGTFRINGVGMQVGVVPAE